MVLEKRVSFRRWLTLVVAALVFSTSMGARAQLPTVADQVADEVEYFLNYYRDYHFNKVFYLGDPTIICPIVRKARGDIDPEYCQGVDAAAAAIPGPPHVMKVRRHPSIWDSGRFPNALTMWHESLHLVEYTDGDTKVGTEDFNERHTAYFEFMARTARKLARLEDKAKDPSISLGTLKSMWDEIDAAIKRGDELNKTYPHGDNIPAFSRRIGAQVDLSKVESLYRSGRAGDRLREMFEAATASGFVVEAIVPQQLGPRQWEFALQYRAKGVPPGKPWQGLATIRILKPDGSLLQTLNQQLPGRGTDRQAQVISVSVPRSAPDGLYKANFIVRLQQHSLAHAPYLTKTFPITTPAPPPVATNPTPRWSPTPVPMPEVTPPPTPIQFVPLQVGVKGPKRVKAGSPVAVSVNIIKGVPPFRWRWSGGGRDGRGSGTSFAPSVSAARGSSVDFQIEVWDSGRYKSSPFLTSHRVEVVGHSTRPEPEQATDPLTDVRPLRAAIVAPAKGAPGDPVTLTAKVDGGKPPYRYRWRLDSGAVLEKPEIKGRLKGEVGDIKLIQLVVEDSLSPPQTANASHRIELVEGGLRITKLEVSPSKVEPGQKARVTVYFKGSNPGASDDPVKVKIWVEKSPGAGKGRTKNGTFPISKGKASGTFPISKDAQPGTLRVVSTVAREGQSDKRAASLVVREPVRVEDAIQSDFVGSYMLTDPKRTSKQYRTELVLYANGKGRGRDWLNGKISRGPTAQKDGFAPLYWRFEGGQLTLDWTLNGKHSNLGFFKGSVAGFTSNFTLSGRYAGGSQGTMRVRRR